MTTESKRVSEGRRTTICATVLLPLYGLVASPRFRSLLRRVTLRLEGGAMYSLTVREMYRRFHDLEVGLYTIGPCEAGPEGFAPGTRIGRYASIYYTVRTLLRDAPESSRVPPGLYGDDALGEIPTAESATGPVIGHDVFIGHQAIILPSVEEIGHGAFIGAGSVVRSSVPPFAVVMGNPARVVRYRFSEATIAELMASKWWCNSLDELESEMDTFQRPLEGEEAS